MKLAQIIGLGLLAGWLGAAQAGPVENLLASKSCMACHSTEQKIVGPAYKDVAAKYKSDKNAVNKLALKIQKGGSGAWGQVPMPANSVTEAEAKLLAQWVMTRK